MTIHETAQATAVGRNSGSSAIERRDAKVRRRQTWRLAALGTVVALAIALVINNYQIVAVSYLLGTASVPLVIILALAFALGGAAENLVNRRRQKR